MKMLETTITSPLEASPQGTTLFEIKFEPRVTLYEREALHSPLA